MSEQDPRIDLENVTAADIPRMVAELREHRRLVVQIERARDEMPRVRIEWDGEPIIEGRLEGFRIA